MLEACRNLLIPAAAFALGLSLLVPGTARGATWEEVSPLVRRSLAAQLSPSEVERLLGRAEVRAHLAEVLEGWDGRDDTLEVRRDGRVLVVRVGIGTERRSCLDLGATPETSERPACSTWVERVGDREIKLDASLWTPAKPRPPRSKPRAEKAPPAPAEAAGLSVLRRAPELAPDRAIAGLDPEVVRLLAGHAELRARLGREAHWRDPLAPGGGALDGEPFDAELPRGAARVPGGPSIEGNAKENLRYAFDPSRMRPEDPVPDFFGNYARRPLEACADSGESEPGAACLRAWVDGGNGARPPTLQCFRGTLRRLRLDKNDVYQAARIAGAFIPFPIFQDIAAAEVKKASDETVSTSLWAATWLAWARLHPEGIDGAVAALDRAERRQLRSRLWRWWQSRAHAEHEAIIGELYARHLGALYPEMQTRDGWPRRSRYPDDYLWATNYLAEMGHRGSAPAAAALAALSEEDRRLLRVALSDPRLLERHGVAGRLLRRRAEASAEARVERAPEGR